MVDKYFASFEEQGIGAALLQSEPVVVDFLQWALCHHQSTDGVWSLYFSSSHRTRTIQLQHRIP